MAGSWTKVGTIDDFPPGSGRVVGCDEARLAIFNVDGGLFAIDDACPHHGASLAAGTLHEGRVICPLHSWVFDLASGRCPRDSHEPVTTYPVRWDGDVVEVLVPSP